jgi:hypothetical protein
MFQPDFEKNEFFILLKAKKTKNPYLLAWIRKEIISFQAIVWDFLEDIRRTTSSLLLKDDIIRVMDRMDSMMTGFAQQAENMDDVAWNIFKFLKTKEKLQSLVVNVLDTFLALMLYENFVRTIDNTLEINKTEYVDYKAPWLIAISKIFALDAGKKNKVKTPFYGIQVMILYVMNLFEYFINNFIDDKDASTLWMDPDLLENTNKVYKSLNNASNFFQACSCKADDSDFKCMCDDVDNTQKEIILHVNNKGFPMHSFPSMSQIMLNNSQ